MPVLALHMPPLIIHASKAFPTPLTRDYRAGEGPFTRSVMFA